MREKFMFFANFKETADKLPDDLRLKFYDAMTDYVFNGVESDDPVVSALVTAIKFSLDKVDGRANNGGNHNPTGVNQYKIEQDKEVNSVKVGQSRSIPLETETETRNRNNISPICNSDELHFSPYNGPEKCSCDCVRKAKFEINGKKFCGQHTRIELSKLGRLDLIPGERFQKPTIEQVKAYCQARNNDVDAERFMDFYESKGWKVGNQPMKDWEAAVRTWEKREQRKPVESVNTPDTGGKSVLVEEGRFYIDDTMPEYRENCQKLTDDELERAWKWIMDHFRGQKISVDFVNGILKKFDTSQTFRQAQGF